MIVVSMTKCPPKLRGDLSKWLLEINTGVYVGNVSARVRDALWARICENIRDGQATMVFTTNNEQHMDFRVHNTEWKPVDLDGIKLIKRPSGKEANALPELHEGFSNAAKQRIGKRCRRTCTENEYVLLDLETTGLSPETDEIIEAGVIKISGGRTVAEKSRLIIAEKAVPPEITKITGITDDELKSRGVQLNEALEELFETIENQKVVCYNASFDITFLEKAAEKIGMDIPDFSVIDVLAMARHKIKSAPNYKLETIAKMLNISTAQSHRAAEDSKLLDRVYRKLNEK